MEQAELTMQYRELDRDCALLFYRIHGGKRHGKGLFIPNEENMAGAWAEWKALKARVEALPAPDPVYDLVRGHLADFMDKLEFDLEDVAKHPEGRFLGFEYRFQDVVRCDRRPDAERCAGLIHEMQELAENRETYVRLIQKNREEKKLAGTANAFRRLRQPLATDECRLAEYFPTFSDEQREQLRVAMEEFRAVLGNMADKIAPPDAPMEEQVPDDLSRTVKMDGEEYRALLKKSLGVELDELLAWHKEEMDRTRAEVFRIAAELDIPEAPPKTMREANDILFQYAGPCDSPEEMFRRSEVYLKRTRALAHEYVSLPEDESCRCVPLPDCLKDSYPWGGYEGGDFSQRPYQGQMFLNQYNYQNVTDGWIKLNALHEAYPGHHVQYVRTAMAETPETVKIGAKYIPLLEGTCLRTERAFAFIYAEDPFFPLFVAYRRHHASTRIYVDLMMYYYGATLEDVIKIYEEELGFERGTARKQVQAHQDMPGYFTCYYYGMKKITEWEKKLGFTKWDYTELLFSAGYISMETFGKLVQLTPAERERYLHGFSSLLA